MKTYTPPRRLRITADDFGFTPGVTDGILEAHEKGIVTHTSIMAGGLDFERAVALARQYPRLHLGVHLTLSWGRPLSPPTEVPSLVGEDGRFPPLGIVLQRFLARRLNQDEVSREWRKQMERVIRAGLAPSHVDSHHHLHLLPGLLPVASALASAYGAPWLRRPAEPLNGNPGTALAKRLFFRVLCLRKWPLPTSDAFRGLALQGRRDFPERLREAFRSLPPGTTEFMVHPGRPDALLEQEDTYVLEREVERQALCDPALKTLLRDLNLELDRSPHGDPESAR